MTAQLEPAEPHKDLVSPFITHCWNSPTWIYGFISTPAPAPEFTNCVVRLQALYLPVQILYYTDYWSGMQGNISTAQSLIWLPQAGTNHGPLALPEKAELCMNKKTMQQALHYPQESLRKTAGQVLLPTAF